MMITLGFCLNLVNFYLDAQFFFETSDYVWEKCKNAKMFPTVNTRDPKCVKTQKNFKDFLWAMPHPFTYVSWHDMKVANIKLSLVKK